MKINQLEILIFIISVRLFSDVLNIPGLDPIITVILFFYIIYLLAFNRLKISVVNIIFFIMLSFFLLNGLFFTLNNDYSFVEPFRSLFRWLTIMGLFFIPKCIVIDKVYLNRNIYNMIVIPGALLILLSLYTGGYQEYQGQLRLTEPFHNPNSLALFCFISIFVVFINFVNTKSKANYFLLLLFIYALFKSGGVTSTLSTLIFISVAALSYFGIKNKILVILIVPLFLISILYFNYNVIIERLNGVVFSDINTFTLSEGSSVYWRFKAWSLYLSSMNVFEYIYGLGLGVSRFLLNPDSFIAKSNYFSAPGTHNDYIQVIVDFGFIGFFIAVLLLVRFISNVYINIKYDANNKVLISFVLSLLLYMTMDNVLDTKFFFLIILIFSTYFKRKKIKE